VAGPSGSTVGRRSDTSIGGAGEPFAETVDTPFYRPYTPAELAVLVLTVLSHGCPTQAIVAAFGLEDRTVARWLARAEGCLSDASRRAGAPWRPPVVLHIQPGSRFVRNVGQLTAGWSVG